MRPSLHMSTVLAVQGGYYLLTGLWPVADIHSFMQVSGFKTDVWLVKMVGLLTVSIGVTLLSGRKNPVMAVYLLAVCAALSYLLIDVTYVFKGTISKVYLADAVAEAVLIVLLFASKKSPAKMT